MVASAYQRNRPGKATAERIIIVLVIGPAGLVIGLLVQVAALVRAGLRPR